ncbi:DNA adenine methylase [Ruminococcaceae bacterium OttesenSCG-928-L11]|nr:DNA adenine methylase [Ruminococcaceae bacterium OttesenSCG-928-L11]
MNSFTSRVGGKKSQREEIVARFPLSYSRYIEVFGGAAWVLFHKPPTPFEVYNDFDGSLVNLFRHVREHPDELREALRYTLNSREDFKRMRDAFKKKLPMDDLTRAAWYYQLMRISYASKMSSFACQPHSMWKDFPLIDAANNRLQQTGVIVENRDFQWLITHYDRDDAFLYLDPPYFSTESYYLAGGFGRKDHIRLRDTLRHAQGKWLLSYNDDRHIRYLYRHYRIEEVERLDNMAQRYENGKLYKELLISNYDTTERRRAEPQQISLFTHTVEKDAVAPFFDRYQ